MQHDVVAFSNSFKTFGLPASGFTTTSSLIVGGGRHLSK